MYHSHRMYRVGGQVGDVVPGMAVEALLKALLVQEMSNEADRAPKDKETIESTHLNVIISFLTSESTRMSKQINKYDRDGSIHIQDQALLLLRRDTLNRKGVVKEGGGGKVGLGEVCDDGDAQVWVGTGLDLVPNSHYELILLAHRIDKLLGTPAVVEGHTEHLSCPIKSSSKALTLFTCVKYM